MKLFLISLTKVSIFFDLDKQNLQLREDPKYGVFVENLKQKKVESLEDTLSFFEIGMSKRSTAETKMNQRSSRSHGIFTIKIEHTVEEDLEDLEDLEQDSQKKNSKKKKIKKNIENLSIKRRSVVHIVDLAGSERQMEYGSERMKESCQINKSLVVLSNVITSLTEKNNKKRFLHFRDSK